MHGTQIESTFSQHVPDAFLRRVLQAIFAAHRLSHEYVLANFAPEEATNLLPYYRRAKIEGYLRDAAAFSNLTASAFKSPGSGWNHTEVSSGPVVMTASSVAYPCGLVEPSDFRISLAEDNQLELWSSSSDEERSSAPLYAMILHSRSRWATSAERARNGHLPGSAYIAFPVAGLTSYIYDINLFERFPDVIADATPREWDEEARVRYMFNARKSATA
jgi:hypothetical protein